MFANITIYITVLLSYSNLNLFVGLSLQDQGHMSFLPQNVRKLTLLTSFFILLFFLLFCNGRLAPQILLFPLLFSLLNHVNILCGFSSSHVSFQPLLCASLSIQLLLSFHGFFFFRLSQLYFSPNLCFSSSLSSSFTVCLSLLMCQAHTITCENVMTEPCCVFMSGTVWGLGLLSNLSSTTFLIFS